MSRAISHLVIHCSASPNGQAITPRDIDRWHHERGFRRAMAFRDLLNLNLEAIGYHFVVMVNSLVATGRHLEEIGAHVQGSNAHSIGICMVGTDHFTPPQWAALAGLVTALRKDYPAAQVLGHRDFSPDIDGDGVVEPWEWMKTCPGFEVADWLAGGMVALADHLLVPAAANESPAAAEGGA